MAKKSMWEREEKKGLLVEKHRVKRLELKRIIKKSDDPDEIRAAQDNLHKLPLNSNPVRHTTRCLQCGRVHSVFSKFKLCRICVRQQINMGNIPGARKSSW